MVYPKASFDVAGTSSCLHPRVTESTQPAACMGCFRRRVQEQQVSLYSAVGLAASRETEADLEHDLCDCICCARIFTLSFSKVQYSNLLI